MIYFKNLEILLPRSMCGTRHSLPLAVPEARRDFGLSDGMTRGSRSRDTSPENP